MIHVIDDHFSPRGSNPDSKQNEAQIALLNRMIDTLTREKSTLTQQIRTLTEQAPTGTRGLEMQIANLTTTIKNQREAIKSQALEINELRSFQFKGITVVIIVAIIAIYILTNIKIC